MIYEFTRSWCSTKWDLILPQCDFTPNRIVRQWLSGQVCSPPRDPCFKLHTGCGVYRISGLWNSRPLEPSGSTPAPRNPLPATGFRCWKGRHKYTSAGCENSLNCWMALFKRSVDHSIAEHQIEIQYTLCKEQRNASGSKQPSNAYVNPKSVWNA